MPIQEMMKWNLVIFFIFLQFQDITPYPSGAPGRACSTMLPSHGALPQSSQSPFSIKAESLRNSINVIIEDTVNKTPFRGFLLKAIQEDGTDIVNGKFEVKDSKLAHTLECDSGSQAFTHSSKDEKSKIITTWSPPAGFSGPVTFRATVVVEFKKIWVGITSNQVIVTSIQINKKTTSSPIMQTSTVLPNTDLYFGCGSTKGCFGLPNDCVGKRICEVILTYADVPSARQVHFQLVGALGAKGGWIAMGLSRNGKMGESSVTECVLVRGAVEVRESWNYAKPRRGNFVLEGPKNITNDTGEYENGVITCGWNRHYETIANGISFDILADKFYILLAKGPVDNSGNKLQHTIELPSAKSVNLTSASLVVGKLSTLVKIHGSFMTAAWIGFVSIGILLARHYKEVWVEYKLCGEKVWFAVHRCFMLLSVALIIAGFVSIFIDVDGWSQVGPNPHPILGCIATGLAVLQPFIAVCRPPPTSPKRPIFRWIHGLVGNGAQLIAVVNMFFAVSLKNSNVPQAFNWVLVTFLIFHCLVHLLIHIHSCFMIRERGIFSARSGNMKIQQMELSDNYDDQEAPGSAFKRFMLGLHSLVTICLTAALILMICLN